MRNFSLLADVYSRVKLGCRIRNKAECLRPLSRTLLPLPPPSSIIWYWQKMGGKLVLHMTYWPHVPWSCSFTWCLVWMIAEKCDIILLFIPWLLNVINAKQIVMYHVTVDDILSYMTWECVFGELGDVWLMRASLSFVWLWLIVFFRESVPLVLIYGTCGIPANPVCFRGGTNSHIQVRFECAFKSV